MTDFKMDDLNVRLVDAAVDIAELISSKLENLKPHERQLVLATVDQIIFEQFAIIEDCQPEELH